MPHLHGCSDARARAVTQALQPGHAHRPADAGRAGACASQHHHTRTSLTWGPGLLARGLARHQGGDRPERGPEQRAVLVSQRTSFRVRLQDGRAAGFGRANRRPTALRGVHRGRRRGMILIELGPVTAYRMHAPRWATEPTSGAGGSLRWRVNRPGTPALYLAFEPQIAVRECCVFQRSRTPVSV